MNTETFDEEFEHTIIRDQGDIFEINNKAKQLKEIKADWIS